MEQGLELVLQGRKITASDIEMVKMLIISNPSWNRTRISKELCMRWDWRRATGQLKDIACRSLLRKLEQLGYIQLPPAAQRNDSPARRNNVQPMLHCKKPIRGHLQSISPVKVQLVENSYGLNLFKYFISTYHYLGWSGTVGENMKYLFYDARDRPLGCVMFGAAAWKVQARDNYIGWGADQRSRNLAYVVNNNRFLILPWVSIKCLASHILGQICGRLNRDWQQKYNHPVYLVETFVQKDRFKGTCYRAANWQYVGETKGRGKMDVHKRCLLPVKDIWLYPLERTFREKLCGCS